MFIIIFFFNFMSLLNLIVYIYYSFNTSYYNQKCILLVKNIYPVYNDRITTTPINEFVFEVGNTYLCYIALIMFAYFCSNNF